MAETNTSLPDALKSVADEQARNDEDEGSDNVPESARRDRDRRRLRGLLLEGAGSAFGVVADDGYFDGLRAATRARQPT